MNNKNSNDDEALIQILFFSYCAQFSKPLETKACYKKKGQKDKERKTTQTQEHLYTKNNSTNRNKILKMIDRNKWWSNGEADKIFGEYDGRMCNGLVYGYCLLLNICYTL